ncbi:DUF5017 domain-containing protein [Proteiniphilum sp. X52]|uniref:DUF5017 domain-containing protein n=1 Tax=Proteiniphilum sp. X52 TaxID=2382159 RepID=UPI000F0A87F5|nr:DUF5017 domain-containing protein [Proteiniphilum sp. X52]RNC66398.1 DUF5017 domain-containing protein [Proteiniphilum sp. X52]
MKSFYTILFLIPVFFLSSCEDILKDVDFTVTPNKTSYTAGEEVVFRFADAPDWVTFYSGEEGRTYPDSYGTSIKSITKELLTYAYIYDSPGSYQVVFVGGNTNYKGNKEQVITMTITVN